ncbi:MAG: hypothetical protein MZV64_32400 [Ignavibacteriales bacterium]|nr:hypothetical protein [Ignavibacteriales bacterium]
MLIALQHLLELEYSSWHQDLIQHLIEGVAEAADGFYDENSIHYLASLGI